jgi:hypothetical protein
LETCLWVKKEKETLIGATLLGLVQALRGEEGFAKVLGKILPIKIYLLFSQIYPF